MKKSLKNLEKNKQKNYSSKKKGREKCGIDKIKKI